MVESLSLKDVLRALYSNDIEIKFKKKTMGNGLQARGKSEKQSQYKDKRNKSKSISRRVC